MATAALCLGVATITLRVGLGLVAAPDAAPAPLPTIHGTLGRGGSDVSSPSGGEQRAFLRLAATSDDRARPMARGAGEWLVYAWLPRYPAVAPGDRLVVEGRAEPPPQDAAGFAGFLAGRGAVGTLKATDMALAAAEGGSGSSVEHLRRTIDEAIGRAIPEPEAGLASGILVGLRDRVSRPVADDFTTTGLSHVVAISGWNIALVAGIATALLRGLGLGRRPRSLLVIVAILAYTIVAGAEASVVRAALMGAVVLVAREGGHPSGAAGALGLACLGLLAVEPTMVGDVGLQLSLAATAGLLALGGPGVALVTRVTRGRAPGWFSETLGVSLAAQLSTLPLILLHFGRLSLISPLANLVMAPLVPLAMLGAALGVGLGPLESAPIVGPVAAVSALGAWLPLASMVRGASLLADVPLASVELPEGTGSLAALPALLALVIVLRRTRRTTALADWADTEPAPSATPPASPTGRRRRLAIGAMTLALVALVVVAAGRMDGRLRISVLDVGQGDAILLETASGQRLLVDGGPDPDLLVRRLDERIPIWDRHLDLILVTHPHEDHVAGLAGLMQRYRVDRVIETGLDVDGAGIRELRAAAGRAGVPRIRVSQGDAFRFGDATVTVVWPPIDLLGSSRPATNREMNDSSIVLAVAVGQQRALLTGDIEDDRDGELLTALGQQGVAWDLLKVAHHGSATATSGALLEAMRPRVAAISVGLDNDYGHPTRETLARLAAAGATIWRTDLQGTLALTLDGGGSAANARSGRAPGSGSAWPATLGGDGGPHPSRGARPAALVPALAASAAARHRRGRGGGVPGTPRGTGGRGRGPPPGGNGGTPARRRQGPAGRPPPEEPQPRRGRRRLAARLRSPGAGTSSGQPPGGAARGPGGGRLVGHGAARGAPGVLCGQARHAACRQPRAALRPLASAPSRVRRPAGYGLRSCAGARGEHLRMRSA